MTGPEHYRTAEGLMRRAASREHDDLSHGFMMAAQVHATLALAAATGLTRERVLPLADYKAWYGVAGEKTEEEGR